MYVNFMLVSTSIIQFIAIAYNIYIVHGIELCGMIGSCAMVFISTFEFLNNVFNLSV